jgi:YMGG-like Gly-zipper
MYERQLKMTTKSIMTVAVLAALISTSVSAQMIIYPAKGQSAQQQQKDEAECYTWAKGQTGYDPAQATQPVAPPPPQQQSTEGTVVKGAAVGALGGAAIGAIAGNAGKGAAIGAVGGTVVGGVRKNRKQQANDQANAQYQQQVAQQQQNSAQQQQNFQRAYAACFEGRGYTVK